MGNLQMSLNVVNGNSAVAQVKKHLLQPMAYLTFHSAEIARAVLMDPPGSVGGITTLPARPHKTDPNSVVLRWNGAPTDLSEEAIVTDFNIIFSPSPGLLEGNSGSETAG